MFVLLVCISSVSGACLVNCTDCCTRFVGVVSVCAFEAAIVSAVLVIISGVILVTVSVCCLMCGMGCCWSGGCCCIKVGGSCITGARCIVAALLVCLVVVYLAQALHIVVLCLVVC